MLHSRDKRIEESIKQALSRIIQFEVKDPRVPPIFTVTRVEITKDLRHAKVHYSQMPDDEESLEGTEDFLEDSAGYLRSMIAREVNLKFTPELHFHYDPSQKHYHEIDAKLQDLRRRGQMGTDEDDQPEKEEE